MDTKDLLNEGKRELEEESGFRARFIKEIGRYWVAAGQTDQEGIVLLAADLSKGVIVHEGAELSMRIKDLSFDQILKMIKSGEIKDSPTISAFEFRRPYKGK